MYWKNDFISNVEIWQGFPAAAKQFLDMKQSRKKIQGSEIVKTEKKNKKTSGIMDNNRLYDCSAVFLLEGCMMVASCLLLWPPDWKAQAAPLVNPLLTSSYFHSAHYVSTSHIDSGLDGDLTDEVLKIFVSRGATSDRASARTVIEGTEVLQDVAVYPEPVPCSWASSTHSISAAQKELKNTFEKRF